MCQTKHGRSGLVLVGPRAAWRPSAPAADKHQHDTNSSGERQRGTSSPSRITWNSNLNQSCQYRNLECKC